MMTCSVRYRPPSAETERTAPPATSMAVTAALVTTVTPRSLAARTYAFTRLFGCRYPSVGDQRAALTEPVRSSTG